MGLTRFHKILFLLCFLVTTGEGYNLFLYGAVLPLLAAEWGLSAAAAGLVGSASLVGIALGSILLGRLADQTGRKKVLLLSVFLLSVFTFLCGFAPNVYVFSALRLIAGVGIGGALPNVIALVTENMPPQARHTMTALMLCGIQVGGSLGPLVSLLTLERFGWHVVLWLGGVTLLLAPFLQKYLPADARERSEGRSAAAPPGSALFRVGARRNHFCFWTACFMTLFLIYGLGTWLPELMLRSGNSMDSSLIFPIVMNIGGIIGSFLFASLADRKLGARKTLVALYVLSAVSVYALGIHAPAPALFAVLFLAGAGVFGAQNIANAYVSAYYPASLRTTGLGWYNGIGRAGAICGSAVWGILLEWSLPVPTTFLIFALPALAGGLAFLSVREKMDPGMKPE